MNRCDTFLVRAVAATVIVAARFHAMANDLASAMLAFGGERMNGALKAIEIMRDAICDNLQRLVVFVSANFTMGHKKKL